MFTVLRKATELNNLTLTKHAWNLAYFSISGRGCKCLVTDDYLSVHTAWQPFTKNIGKRSMVAQ